MKHSIICSLTSLAFTALTYGQVSPAQGPSAPAINSIIREFHIQSALTPILKGTIEQEVTAMNAAPAAGTDQRAKISLE